MINIACLPLAGEENPYQKLMMQGLSNSGGLNVYHGSAGKFFAILMTAVKLKPDYIHFDWLHQYYLRRSHWMTYLFYPLFVLQVLIVKHILGIKLVWTLHNITPHDHVYFGPYKWARIFFARQCTWIRVFSEDTVIKASKELNITIERFKIVPEGSYVGHYPNTFSKEESRSSLSISMDKHVFLFFGSMRPYKGIEDLIRTYKNYRKENTMLIIAGQCISKNYRGQIEQLLEGYDDILLKACTIDVVDVQLFMNASDIVVLPFKKVENSGSTILAMGFKKPVIAPHVGVLPLRLRSQKELLYNDSLDEIFLKTLNMSSEELSSIGNQNFENLTKFKWVDYGKCFN